MKQATNPFAPVPLWRKRLPGYAAMGVATIALAVGLTTLQNARTTVAGTLLPVSEADAAAYGISAVYQLDDGNYRVEGSQKGFQSDVQAAVTDIAWLPPLARRRIVGMGPDVAHHGPGHEKRQDERNQAPQQRQPPTGHELRR